jgi:hypothetical protein
MTDPVAPPPIAVSPEELYAPVVSTPQDSNTRVRISRSLQVFYPDINGPLFPLFLWEDAQPVTQPKPLPELDTSELITVTPTSPVLDTFDPSQLSSAPTTSTSIVQPTVARRRSPFKKPTSSVGN